MRALAQVAAWPVGHASAGVLVSGGRGSPERHVVGDTEAAYGWASVTKLCTTLAVLVAAEEGSVHLDEPAGPSGSSLAHLLAHASGLPPDVGPPLAAPGRRRIYSSLGFRVLGDELGRRSGLDFGVYLEEAVLRPLGMRCRWGAGARADPATGLSGDLFDLLAVGAEILRPTILSAETMQRATEVAFPGLDGVLPGFGRQSPCDWGLGFERRGDKCPHWTGESNAPHTVGHFGQSGAFLWADRAAGVVCAALTDRLFGPWAAAAWPQLSDAVLQEVGGGS